MVQFGAIWRILSGVWWTNEVYKICFKNDWIMKIFFFIIVFLKIFWIFCYSIFSGYWESQNLQPYAVDAFNAGMWRIKVVLFDLPYILHTNNDISQLSCTYLTYRNLTLAQWNQNKEPVTECRYLHCKLETVMGLEISTLSERVYIMFALQ